MKEKLRHGLVVAWIALLPISWWTMSVREISKPTGPEWHEILLPAGDGTTSPMRYRKIAGSDPTKPAVVLLHGSPMASSCFDALLRELGRDRTLLIPDLPGFGASRSGFTDLSFSAHAEAIRSLLKKESSDPVHLVAYSQGGGPALSLAETTPGAVASLTLLSSIGVQEHELSGDYFLNHVLHGAQWIALEAMRWGLPHFGLLDDLMLNTCYGRNFYQSDLRPLRQSLQSLDFPVLIQHGKSDFQVPTSAAREHHRIVPQSELVWFEGGHLVLMSRAPGIAAGLEGFFQRVDDGRASTRATAQPARISAASLPMDEHVMRLSGKALWITSLAIGLATLVSEDLACIAAGLLTARGLIPLTAAIAACFTGIWAGDMALYALGRFGGGWVFARWPFRHLVPESSLLPAREWLRQRSGMAIFASRFMPGTRLPLYLAAGLLKLPVLPMMTWFAIAAVVWAVPVVSLVAHFGEGASQWLMDRGTRIFPLALLLLVCSWIALRILPLLATHKGRRILRAGWERTTRWEFWPPAIFYPPVVIAAIAMGLRRRHPLAFTAANPGIPHSGVAGESKSSILRALLPSGSVVPFLLLPAGDEDRAERVESWMEEHGFRFPLVVKPDAGERGRDVRIVSDVVRLREELDARKVDTIVQIFAPGEEFGIFYTRHPDEASGRIFSLTVKQLLSVKGDGRRSLEELILDDDRAYLSHRLFRRLHSPRLATIPADGEVVPLGELGSHCRGALFLNGASLVTPELEREVDRIAKTFSGFHFGRFDIRCPDQAHLGRGEGLKILELNGVTSEATHIYHPHTPLFTGYRTLFAQWRKAFDIGLANHSRGAQISRFGDLAKLLWNHRRNTRP